MKTTLFSLLLAILSTVSVQAQTQFKGYYVTLTGDTVQVLFPSYRQWELNPPEIKAVGPDNKEVVLTPQSVKVVHINGYDEYVSRRFTRLTNPVNAISDYRNISPEDSVADLQGFLMVLLKSGGYTLYKYVDTKRKNFFLEEPNGSFTELLYKISSTELQVRDDNRFKQQLQKAFYTKLTNDRLYASLEKLEYSEDALVSFISQVTGEKRKKQKMYPSEWTLLGGVAYNTLEEKDLIDETRIKEASYTTSVSPVIGIGYIAYNDRNLGRDFIVIQAKYYNHKNKAVMSTNTGVRTSTFQSNVVNFHIGLGMKVLRQPSFTWHAAVAPALTMMIGHKEHTTFGPIVQDLEESWVLRFNVALQTGIWWKGNLGLWVHYNLLPNEVSDYSVVFADYHRSMQAGIDWKFRRK